MRLPAAHLPPPVLVALTVLTIVTVTLATPMPTNPPLSFDLCTYSGECVGSRTCNSIYSYSSRHSLYPCYQEDTCFCVPPVLLPCDASAQCMRGERCVHTAPGSSVCVACVAAEHVPSFVPIDSRTELQCRPLPVSPSPSPSSYSWSYDPNYPSDEPYYSSDEPYYSPDEPYYPTDEPDYHEAPANSTYPSDEYEHELEPEMSPGPGRNRDPGYAFDFCNIPSECQSSYSCRSLGGNPLLSCPLDYIFDGTCLCLPDRYEQCESSADCHPREFCFSGIPGLNTCASRDQLLAYGTDNTNGIDDTDVSPMPEPYTTDLPMYSSYPEASIIPDDLSSDNNLEGSDYPEESDSSLPNWDRNDGFTLSTCYGDYSCEGERRCLAAFNVGDPYARCDYRESCYCLPDELRPCSGPSACEQEETCVSSDGTSRAYCVSRYVATDTEALVEQFGYVAMPSDSPIEIMPSPSLDGVDVGDPPLGAPSALLRGLTFDTCLTEDDCIGGRACLAVNLTTCEMVGSCLCIPTVLGSRTCTGDDQCVEGESCLSKYDFLPSFCVSTYTKTYRSELFIIHGVDYVEKDKYFTWEPKNQNMSSQLLTGDTCMSTGMCAGERRCRELTVEDNSCADGLAMRANGLDAPVCYCYPYQDYRQCSFSVQCPSGEICGQIDRLGSICMSRGAAERNGVVVLPMGTPFPRIFANKVRWDLAPDVLALQFEKEESGKRFTGRVIGPLSERMNIAASLKESADKRKDVGLPLREFLEKLKYGSTSQRSKTVMSMDSDIRNLVKIVDGKK